MRLLIVDDSALMRRLLTECFESEPDIELRTARDGLDALEKAREFEPDVVTLDINMPRMDGLTCLAHLTEIWPCPVVMVSSLTEKGALATFEALELGALDFVAKPGGTVSLNIQSVFEELRDKVWAAHATGKAPRDRARRPVAPRPKRAARPLDRLPEAPPASKPPRATRRDIGSVDLVLVGSSTGGPRALGELLEALPANFPAPILIAQHMPERFTAILSERLDSSCAISVREVTSATMLQPGTAYFATGGADVTLRRKFRKLSAHPAPACDSFTWHPSVSRMVASAMECLPARRMIGIMLTGMGDDGAAEMTALHASGAPTIAEAEETAAVFGMPQKLIENGGASVVLPSHRIAEQLLRWTMSANATRRSTECL